MLIQSLGHLTDLIFAKFSGSVINKGSYTVIQTPNNPNYHWGNYIIFKHAPQKGSLKEWKAIFDKEFGYYQGPHHYVFTWDVIENNNIHYQEFLDANFDFESTTVLSAASLTPPLNLNNNIHIRKIVSDQDWEDVLDLQVLCADPKFINDYYQQFKQQQMNSYRQMSESGIGAWFGAFLGDKLVGDLGIFYEGKVGRYQNVGTHPDYRKQGICANLVYQTGMLAFKQFGVEKLVMQADIAYHAARIYESVGFKRNEVNHSLSWWKDKDL